MAEWPTVALSEVADLTVGHVGPMATEYVDSGVTFLRSQNVLPMRLDLSDVKFVSREFHKRLAKSALRPGDVVIVRTGRPGACAVVPNELAEANCSDLVVIRPGSQLEPRFLCYYVNAIAGAHVDAYTVGAVQQHFNVGAAKVMRVPLPPIDEQRRIADILGALDDKIDLNRRIARSLASLCSAIFQSVFAGTDVGAARQVAIGDVFEVVMGQSPPGDTYNSHANGLPFFQGRVDFGARYPTRRIYCTAPTRLARAGDTLLSVRAPVGDANVATEACAIGRGVAALRHRVGGPTYTFEVVKSARPALDVYNGEGTVFGSIGGKELRSILVPEPDRAAIADFDRRVEPIEARLRLLDVERVGLSSIRDALLPRLLSGDLEVPA